MRLKGHLLLSTWMDVFNGPEHWQEGEYLLYVLLAHLSIFIEIINSKCQLQLLLKIACEDLSHSCEELLLVNKAIAILIQRG